MAGGPALKGPWVDNCSDVHPSTPGACCSRHRSEIRPLGAIVHLLKFGVSRPGRSALSAAWKKNFAWALDFRAWLERPSRGPAETRCAREGHRPGRGMTHNSTRNKEEARHAQEAIHRYDGARRARHGA